MSSGSDASKARVSRSVSTGLLLSAQAAAGLSGVEPVSSGDSIASVAAGGALSSRAPDAQGRSSSLGRSKQTYDRLNLTINDLGEAEGGSLVKEHRHVSMFWQEKLSLLLFFLQLHAIIWLQCYQFYPQQWREWWRWTLVSILDIHHLIKDSGGSNSASDSMAHSVFILALPLVCFAAYELLTRRVYADRVSGSTSADRHRVSYLTFQRWSLLLAEQLYVPVLLLWCRLWTCGTKDQVLYVQQEWTCWGGQHIAFFVITSVIAAATCTAIPVMLYTRTKRILVFHDPAMHERYLQSRELEYLMGVNNLYEYTHFFFIGSFRRFWAWSRLFQLMQKLLLVVLLLGLSTLNAGDHLVLQATLFLLIISGPVLLNVCYRTYRCSASNYLKAIFDGVLFFTCVMNVIEANINGFTSSFIDPYTFSGMMLLVNLVGLGGAILLCAYHATREVHARRKAAAAHNGAHVDIFWPVCEVDLLALHTARPEMVATLNAGKRLLEDAARTTEESYPRHHLLDAIHAMRGLLHDAKVRREGSGSRSSLLSERARRRPLHRQLSAAEEAELLRTLRTGDEKSIALEWTLQDMVEDLALMYNSMAARDNREGAPPAAAGAEKESARTERMQRALDGFSSSLQHKSLERALMHPYKRDFLAKLLTIKALCTAGNPNFVYGERPAWAAPFVAPPLEPQQHAQGVCSVRQKFDSARGHMQVGGDVRIRIEAPLMHEANDDPNFSDEVE